MAGEPDAQQGKEPTTPTKVATEDWWHKQEMEKLQDAREAREVMVRGQSIDAARDIIKGRVNRLYNISDVIRDADAIAKFVLYGTVPEKEEITETETHGSDE